MTGAFGTNVVVIEQQSLDARVDLQTQKQSHVSEVLTPVKKIQRKSTNLQRVGNKTGAIVTDLVAVQVDFRERLVLLQTRK